MAGLNYQYVRKSQQQSSAHVPGFVFFALHHGFTLIELIVVILIAGILAAVALPRWGGETGFEGRRLRDETMSALRYAQKSAIAARRTVCAKFSATAAEFKIATVASAADCTNSTPLMGPQGDGALVVTATDSRFGSFPASIVFDARGRTAATSIVVENLTGLPITVEAETGYVH